MELCNGGDLDNFRKVKGGHLNEQESRLILRQILKGIAAIKEKNVMHRDLKLPNVMLHFTDLKLNAYSDSKMILNEYLSSFNFEN